MLKHEPSGIEIDLSLAGRPFEREVIERAVERSVRGVSFRVATPEDIVVMKAIAMRPRDIADIGAILEAGHELDLTRVRGLLKAFTEALESDDFLARRRRRCARAPASAKEMISVPRHHQGDAPSG